MHALLLPPQQRLRRGGGCSGGGGGGTSPARLEVNQLPALGDKLLKYTASNWTLVNQEVCVCVCVCWQGQLRGGLKLWGWGMGLKTDKRHGYERSGISHVNNVHVEYANAAYSTRCKHIFKAPGTLKSGDKRGQGAFWKAPVHVCACMLMNVTHRGFVLLLIRVFFFF